MARGKTDPNRMVSEVPPVDVAPEPIPEPVPAPPPVEVPTYRVEQGETMIIDVRRFGDEVRSGVFRLSRFIDGADYKDVLNNRLIWSIGRNVHDGRVEAAVDTRYYGDPNWECLFLR